MSTTTKKIPKVTLPRATNEIEAIENVNEAIKFAEAFIEQVRVWKNDANKSAGQRARAYMHNLRNNAATVNKSMTDADKFWRVG